jgi:hypothetical protein
VGGRHTGLGSAGLASTDWSCVQGWAWPVARPCRGSVGWSRRTHLGHAGWSGGSARAQVCDGSARPERCHDGRAGAGRGIAKAERGYAEAWRSHAGAMRAARGGRAADIH